MNLKRNPVAIAGSIVGLLMSMIAWLNVMGYLSWTPDQVSATEQMATIAMPLLMMAATTVITWYKVTPMSDPRDDDGAPLTRPDGSPAMRAR